MCMYFLPINPRINHSKNPSDNETTALTGKYITSLLRVNNLLKIQNNKFFVSLSNITPRTRY